VGGALTMGAMPGEMRAPNGGHRDEHSQALLVMTRYESTLIGVLPDWKTGAGSPPCVHYLGIRSRFGSDPFEQIEYQGFHRIRQRSLSWLAVANTGRGPSRAPLAQPLCLEREVASVEPPGQARHQRTEHA
jgi:hypothetical protein